MSGFNSIDTAHRLEERGFSRDQAEVLAQLFADLWGGVVTRQVLREELANTHQETVKEFAVIREETAREFAALREETAREFTALREETTREFAALREETTREFAAVRQEAAREFAAVAREFAAVRADIATTARDLEQRLTIRLGGMLFVAVGAFSTIIHFWK